MGEQLELFRNGSLDADITTTTVFNANGAHPHCHFGPHEPEITLGTDQDPYNKEELVHTLRGRELGFFIVFYVVAVMAIVLMFEFFMPVLFNPNYPNS